MAHCPEALDLIPDGPEDVFERAILVQRLLISGLSDLGDGDIAEAAQLLWGDDPDTRGRLLKDRRRIAADHLGISVSYFRRRNGYEDQILDDLAVEIWRRLTGSLA
jgi:hypothetical protein